MPRLWRWRVASVLFATRQRHGTHERFLVIVVPNVFAGGVVLGLLPTEPSSKSTLVRTKAPPPPCSKSISALDQESVLASPLRICLFQPKSQMGRVSSKAQ